VYIHDARREATGIYPLSSVVQRKSMVKNTALAQQSCFKGEVKSPRMVQTDNTFSAALVQPLQEVQPMAA